MGVVDFLEYLQRHRMSETSSTESGHRKTEDLEETITSKSGVVLNKEENTHKINVEDNSDAG